jgi:ketol-acid reductoisomerase
VNKATKKEMKKVLADIQSGKFARRWIRENRTGKKTYAKLLKKDLDHPIEKVGARLRERMPWLEQA